MILEAEGATTMAAGEVNVVEVMIVVATTTDAILLLASAIVDLMEQVMLGEETEGTEDATTIHVRHPDLHVEQGEGLVTIAGLTPYQVADGGGLDAVFYQMCFDIFHGAKIYVFSISRYMRRRFSAKCTVFLQLSGI